MGKSAGNSPKRKDSSQENSPEKLIVPRRASDLLRDDEEEEPPPLWAWYSQPNQVGLKGSLTAPLTAPNTPTTYPLDSSFHEAIRQRLFNTAPTAIVTTVVPLGSQSTHMICPHCHAEIDTATKTSPSMVAWLSGFIICILGCWMGCCLIPCCINECMNVEHNCPNCNSFLGKYKRG
ncbi:lipopolysaccharide-induced tumor necrosis factor-alpha factor homolog isoform X2 [Macrobrachium nipponense]|uniref:lipopolysaccharide-induced tumor necrosis factor-alpha factor homolog isoform X2 n=1 Tax=Macrobrachium nipponense TaxID=159736 RepID=UPI0030C7F2F9